jgi:hypothetical protein
MFESIQILKRAGEYLTKDFTPEIQAFKQNIFIMIDLSDWNLHHGFTYYVLVKPFDYIHLTFAKFGVPTENGLVINQLLISPEQEIVPMIIS